MSRLGRYVAMWPGRERPRHRDPDDIRGQDIELSHTDAEGRLVLADVLWYVAQEIKPTIHGRSRDPDRCDHVGAGTRTRRPVSNNDELAERLSRSAPSRREGLAHAARPEYDKSDRFAIADMKNTGTRNGGRHRRPVPAALCR